MTRGELRALVSERGLENEVTIPARDLQDLLSLATDYNFVMMEIEQIAKYEYTEADWEVWKNAAYAHVERVNDRVHPAGFDIPACMFLASLWVMIDKARSLVMIRPPSDWS